MRRPLQLIVGACLTAALTLPGPPAQAASRSFDDARRDAPGSNDIIRTKVTNGSRIGVRIQHRDLTRSASDVQFKLRTSAGAEWQVFASLDGSGGAVYDSEFQVHSCAGLRATRSLGKDRTVLSVPRSCVGSPSGRIKIRPRVQWSSDGARGDWSINRGDHFTPWIPR